MRKNQPGQKLRVFAFLLATGQPVTGDADNITCAVSLDWGALEPLAAEHPAEVGGGYYLFDLGQDETDADVAGFYPTSATEGVQVIVAPEVEMVADAAAQLLVADRYIDTSTEPWQLVLIKQGTGGLGVGEELLRQDLRDIDGNAIESADTVIGQSVAPASEP